MKIQQAVIRVSDYLKANQGNPEFCTITQIRMECGIGLRQTKTAINILNAMGKVRKKRVGNKTIAIYKNEL